jgi:Protein of unknown function (DUF3435)
MYAKQYYGISTNNLTLLNLPGPVHFTDLEWNRVLGHSDSKILERHYQNNFVPRSLQQVVLLRPSQDGLVQRAGG